MPPAYYKYGDEEAYAIFSNIIQQVPESEIILYNFEKLSGYKFSLQIVERLVKDFPKQILGIKDSSYNLYEKLKIPNLGQEEYWSFQIDDYKIRVFSVRS